MQMLVCYNDNLQGKLGFNIGYHDDNMIILLWKIPSQIRHEIWQGKIRQIVNLVLISFIYSFIYSFLIQFYVNFKIISAHMRRASK